jgi:hypothetical protein
MGGGAEDLLLGENKECGSALKGGAPISCSCLTASQAGAIAGLLSLDHDSSGIARLAWVLAGSGNRAIVPAISSRANSCRKRRAGKTAVSWARSGAASTVPTPTAATA